MSGSVRVSIISGLTNSEFSLNLLSEQPWMIYMLESQFETDPCRHNCVGGRILFSHFISVM